MYAINADMSVPRMENNRANPLRAPGFADLPLNPVRTAVCA